MATVENVPMLLGLDLNYLPR